MNDQGENLITNGTFIAEDIIIRSNNRETTNPVFDTRESEDVLLVSYFGGIQGRNTYEIVLSDTITDTLQLVLTVQEIGGDCPFTRYTLNAAIYNGSTKALEDIDEGFLIRVIR